MIFNTYLINKNIVEFLQLYLQQNGKKLLVLEANENNPASTCLIHTCIKTGYPTLAITSKDYDPNIPRLNIINYKEIDINNYSFKKKITQLPAIKENSSKPWNELIKYAHMNQIASSLGGIIVGSITKEFLQTRTYQKNSLGDLLPFADLYFSEIKELYPWVEGNLGTSEFTSQELEWAWRENDLSNIIESTEDPTKARDWGRFTLRQRQIIARLNQIEKITRHKKSYIPICKLRKKGLVR